MTKYVPKKYAEKLKRKMEENEQMFGGEYWSPNNHWTNWIPGQSAFKYGLMAGEGVARFRGRTTPANKKAKIKNNFSFSKDLISFMPPVSPKSTSMSYGSSKMGSSSRSSKSVFWPASKSHGGKYRGRLGKGPKRKVGKRKTKKKISKKTKKTYRKRFTKRKQYMRLCKIWKSENRGTLSDPNVVYLGCGAPTTRVSRLSTDAMIFELMRGAGIHIENWSDTVPGVGAYSNIYSIRVFYFDSPINGTLANYEVNFGTSTTFTTLAQNVYNAMVSSYTNNTTHIFQNAEFYAWTNDFAAQAASQNNRTILSTVNLKGFTVEFNIAQTMLVQNQTKAGLAVGGDTDDDQVLDIAANPVYCKIFKRNGNTFLMKRNSTSSATGFQADYSTGIISAQAANFGNHMKEPGQNFLAPCIGSGIIAPGDIKSLSTWRKQRMSFQSFHNKFARQHTAALTELIDVGQVAMIAAEHQLKSEAGEHDILLHYELNTTIKLRYHHKPARALVQITEIN